MTDLPAPQVTPYLADIASQPAVLQALLDEGLAPPVRSLLSDLERFDRIVLTGMGASLHALHPTFLRLVELGLPVWVQETSELLGPAGALVTPSSLLWIVSQSGSSAEVTALLDDLVGPRPTILGVTSQPASPLADAADVVLELHSGEEHTVGTKSYMNTLAAHVLVLGEVTRTGSPKALLGAPGALSAYIDRFDEHVEQLSAEVTGDVAFVLGRGVSLAAVHTGALIIKEAAKVPFEGMSAPQFRHGPLEIVDSGVSVVVLEGSGADRELNRQTLADVRRLGGQGVWLTTKPSGDDLPTPALTGEARPLGEILPLQALSVALARRHGIAPGAFRHIDKVTRTL